MSRGPYGIAGRVDYEQHPLSGRPTYTKPISRRKILLPQQASSGSFWQIPIEIASPAVLRLRTRPVQTPASGVETLELWYAPDPKPDAINNGILAAGGAAVLPSPGLWWYQVICPQVATCELDVEVLDFASETAAYGEIAKPQATTLAQFTKSIPITTDTVLFTGNQFVEAKRVRITLSTGGGPTLWINLGGVASATANVGFLGAVGAVLDLDPLIFPIYSLHAFNTSATSAASVCVSVFS